MCGVCVCTLRPLGLGDMHTNILSLAFQGEKFCTSYDPNSLLYISKVRSHCKLTGIPYEEDCLCLCVGSVVSLSVCWQCGVAVCVLECGVAVCVLAVWCRWCVGCP